MKLFKNGVGRPSNDTLKKRKIYHIILVVLTVVIVLTGINLFIMPMFPIISTSKHAAISGMTVQITSNSKSRPLIIGTKSYSPGTWISQQTSLSDTIFFNKSGKTQINVKVTFTKNSFDNFVQKKYKVFLAGYNSKGKKKASSLSVKIDPMNFTAVKDNSGTRIISYTKTLSIYVTSSITTLRVVAENENKLFATEYLELKTAAIPTVTLKPLSGSKNSKGVVKVTNTGKEYDTKVTINNPSKATLWYRWVKYKNHEMTNPESFDCRKITSTKTVTRGLYVTQSTQKRAGYVRVYTSEAACKSDSNLNKTNDTTGSIQTKNYIASGTIKYQWTKLYNAGSSWYRLKFDYADLKQKIGNQYVNNDRNICYNYALSYGTYIINGNGTYTKPSTNIPENYGAKTYYYSGAYDLYKKIKTKISEDEVPVSIHVTHTNGTKEHWVLVTGYKTGGTSSKIKNGSDLRKYLYILDPWDSDHQIMSNESLATNLHFNRNYVTW